MKGRAGNPPGKRAPPEESVKPKALTTVSNNNNRGDERPALAQPKTRAVVEVVIEKPKIRPKATVVEVEDVEAIPAVITTNRELPFRDVPPVRGSTSTPVLPRKPMEKNLPENHSEQSKAFQVKTNLDNSEAIVVMRKKILDTEIPVKIKYLLGGNSALQKDLNQQTAKTRRPVPSKKAGKTVLEKDVPNFTVRIVEEQSADSDTENADPPRDEKSSESEEPEYETLREDAIEIGDLPYDQYVMVLPQQTGHLPEGAVIMDDPVLQYLDSLAPGQEPKQIFTGVSSAALRCVYPNVNRGGEVESIMDSGSQIVSMSSEEAMKLKVPWDPDIRILMQSANGEVEKTLGLARNIPFSFDAITVYLQVHILKSAPYKALLGRPFEILTESVIANSRDGKQTITMTDPYGGARITIPTHARGTVREMKRASRENEESQQESVKDF
jgi:hypothetical protein